MTIRYGRADCNHKWRYRKDGHEEECGPAICIKCGAFGCFCDVDRDKVPKDIFFDEGEDGDANINGRWENPYVEKKKN